MKLFFVLFFIVNCGVINSFESGSLDFSELERYKGVKYFTYTKADRKNWFDIRKVNFDDNLSTVFLIHGFEADSLDEPLKIKDDLFQFNLNVGRVVIVSWMDYSFVSDSPYVTNGRSDYDIVARDRVPILANDLYEKIVHIRKNDNLGTIELVGFSMGAHVAGQTAKLLKRGIGYTVDQIYGLDPAGPYFEQNLTMALSYSDAKNVIVLHTNMNTYGFGSEIGPNDKKVYGGKKQPNCDAKDDLCSHNQAWNAFSLFLRDKLDTQEKPRIHPFVICIDVSASMLEENRLVRAVQSAKERILHVKSQLFIGIVTFSDDAKTVHKIVQIQGETERNSLIASLPSEVDSRTSIGAGLRLSMNMLQSLKNASDFCSTIVLISDGEQNSNESPKDVVAELQNACIAVSSIGIGKQASTELEEISSRTGGEVAYVMEDGTSEEIAGAMQAFSYIFEKEMDNDDSPIHLPSKRLSLSNGEDVAHFIIDENSGRDTEFKFVSYFLDKVDLRLVSPEGDEYTTKSPEHFYVPNVAKGFRLPIAEPGQWNLTVTQITKNRRSVRSLIDGVATGTTNNPEGKTAIQLTNKVSNRVLEYPQSITISAKLLGDGEYPVVNAEVIAGIQAPNQPTIQLQLLDNGIFPDKLANDGVYTNNVVKLPTVERYSVVVTAKSNNRTMLVRRKVNYFLKDTVDCNVEQNLCQKLGEFEREESAGSIKLLSDANKDRIPPHRVSDLRAVLESKAEKIISLEWTPPTNEVFEIKIKRYDIRALINGTDFENGLQFEEGDLVDGTLNASEPTSAGTERISIKVTERVWNYVLQRNDSIPQLKFALKTVGLNDAISERSNIAWVVIEEKLESSSSTSTTESITTESTVTTKIFRNDESSSSRLCTKNSVATVSTAIALLFIYSKIFT